MGAGKTTAARRLAQRLGWEVADTDDLFEEKYKISVCDFFNKYDEALYRKLESEVLKSTESLEDVVISTGGGTACYFDNMDWMNQHGLTVFLRISQKAGSTHTIFLIMPVPTSSIIYLLGRASCNIGSSHKVYTDHAP